MGLWDDIQAGWNAFINDIQHPAEFEHMIENIVSFFAQEGIYLEHALTSDLIVMLTNLGLDPFETIPRLAERIMQRGGDVVQTFTILVRGVARYGVHDFARGLTCTLIVQPMQRYGNEQADKAIRSAAIHGETIAGMDEILAPLFGVAMPRSQPIASTAPFKGPFAQEMQLFHTNIAGNVTELTAILQPSAGVPRGYANITADIGDFFHFIYLAIVAILLAIIDLILIAIFLGVDVLDLAADFEIGDFSSLAFLAPEEVQFIIDFDQTVWDGAQRFADWLGSLFHSSSASTPTETIDQLAKMYPWASRSLLQSMIDAKLTDQQIAQIMAMINPTVPANQQAAYHALLKQYPSMGLEIAALLGAGMTQDQTTQYLNGLIAQLPAGKFTAGNIIYITTMPNGKVVWMESGNRTAGFIHMAYGNPDAQPPTTGHLDQFINKGLTPAEALTLIMQTLHSGTPIGKSGGGLVYQVTAPGGNTFDILIIVGSNGFVVNAFPFSGVYTPITG